MSTYWSRPEPGIYGDGGPRHFLDVDDLGRAELEAVLDVAAQFKHGHTAAGTATHFDGRTLGMLFQKPSTRTRVSFEAGMTRLGGHAIFLGESDIQLGHGEPLRDTSRALSRYVDFLMARVFTHANAVELAAYADVPVVNGLTDDAHPCQTLADLLTIREHFDGFDDVTAAWVGDGNNVAQSFVLGCALTDVDLRVATPAGYGIDDPVVSRARDLGGDPTLTDDPVEAVAGADVVYTDVWVSMGQEDERDVRLHAFDGFCVSDELLSHAPNASVMHCLPATRGEEITDDVIESDRAIVWEQAENRLHAQTGLLVWLDEQDDTPANE